MSTLRGEVWAQDCNILSAFRLHTVVFKYIYITHKQAYKTSKGKTRSNHKTRTKATAHASLLDKDPRIYLEISNLVSFKLLKQTFFIQKLSKLTISIVHAT
jgi:hypothetical protein